MRDATFSRWVPPIIVGAILIAVPPASSAAAVFAAGLAIGTPTGWPGFGLGMVIAANFIFWQRAQALAAARSEMAKVG